MKKKGLLTIVILLLLAVLIVSGVQVYKLTQINRQLRQAEAYAADEEYERAAEIFAALDRDELAAHCEALALDRDWRQAMALFDDGSYDAAEKRFDRLGDYRDAREYSAKCTVLRARELIDEGDIAQLRETLLRMKTKPEAAGELAALDRELYEKAGELAEQFDMRGACEAWSLLGSYEDAPLLLERGRRILDWMQAGTGDRLIQPSKLYESRENEDVYRLESCYLVIPKDCGADTRFFLYFPGGRNEELFIDYFLYYLMNPAPNTIAVFLRQNGLDNMEAKCGEAAELMDRVAAECGVFMQELVLAGSSLGAYPAMHGALYLYENYRIRTLCVLSLDAGSDWAEGALLLTQEECLALSELGVPFYLFESTWVGMNREGIRRMVNTGNDVTIVGCYYDDHTRITLDAMGMGVVDWALGDRAHDCNPDMYLFIKLEPDA